MAESEPLSIKAFGLGTYIPKFVRVRFKGRSIKSVKDGEFTISVSLGNQS